MKRFVLATVVLAATAVAVPSSALAWGHGGHHGFHRGFHSGPRVFFGAWAPWPYYVPYPVYAYPPPPPPPPPPSDPGWGMPSQAPQSSPDDESAAPDATYGLLQLRGVPDGATVDLDGRFWLRANDLDARWLALPEGRHRLAVRVGDEEPVERRVDVTPGKSQVVRLGPFPRASR